MDTSISPDPGMTTDNDDISVPIDTLAIDGTRPQVGDKVDLKVGGTVSKIVNDVVSVTPETVNGQPIPQDAPGDDMDELATASASAGGIGGY